MLRLIVVAVAAYFAWHYFGWRGAVGVVAAYIVFMLLVNAASTVTGGLNARTTRGKADQLMHHKMTDEEKAHYAASREHERAMIDHRSQFDPELRKRTGG